MKIKITKYGFPQVVVFPALIICFAIVAVLLRSFFPQWFFYTVLAVLAVLMIFTLAFFRDPCRKIPNDNNLLLSPADGTVSDIEIVRNDKLGEKTLRIGIFLSVFNVHINRAPCNVKVHEINYKKGKFKNAIYPDSARVNESNDLLLERTDSPKQMLILRQISGAIARRIVCKAQPGQQLAAGEQFGMIKFGSRTELYLGENKNAEIMVKIGDKVKAGLTPMVRFQEPGHNKGA